MTSRDRAAPSIALKSTHALERKASDFMFQNLGQIADLVRNAGKIREEIERATDSVQAEATAGGGAVTARVNGRMELVAIRVDPALMRDGDAELLEDLIIAAVTQAQGRAREELAKSLQSLTGGLPLPGLFSGK
jgi:DNA-binding YbaB/EbfC family protein